MHTYYPLLGTFAFRRLARLSSNSLLQPTVVASVISCHISYPYLASLAAPCFLFSSSPLLDRPTTPPLATGPEPSVSCLLR